ncbi:hypothetical protein [Halalkalibacter alkalisediminis]|uniref:Uncharacterized protein n=1 Tax=Halalkalibacter alkalisediminis TaxID=935616 RepID=A0ABV6NB27_9BACI|nr:hypothetical protein [Halalkalibacter alkalisediminis]
MKKWCMIPIILSLLMMVLVSPAIAAGTELMTLFSIRITVIEKGIEYEWEYDSPSQYEFEKGDRVMKGPQAKEEMEKILRVLQLDEQEDVNNYVKRLKESHFPELDRIDIRFMNGEGELYTWVWDS